MTGARQQVKGFTLVEVLVYLAVLLMVSTASVAALLSYQDVLAEQRVKRLVTTAGATALERITREVRNADAVNQGASTFGSTNGVLTLSNVGGNDVVFARSGSTLTIQSDAGSAVALTDNAVSVDAFELEFFDNGVSELVRAVVTVSATSSHRSATETFYGGAVVRGSYD